MTQHNSGTDDGRKCWRTARERERLRARFHIRQRVASNTDKDNDDEPETNSDPRDDEVSMLLSESSIITQVQHYITYIKSGDRSKFSLSQLDTNFHLVSCRIPMSILATATATTCLVAGNSSSSLQDHSLQLCTAWFGLDYSQRLQSYLGSLETFTLMEYAAWMGKYSIVGALLLAGVNPCLRGRLRQLDDDDCKRRNNNDNTDWSVSMGSRVSKRFFNCFPLALSTYIVKRVVALRQEAWAHYHRNNSTTTTVVSGDSDSDFDSNASCECCGQSTSWTDDCLRFHRCHHSICEVCFWKDLLEHIDHRGDFKDVVVCPCCGKGDADTDTGDGDSSQEDLVSTHGDHWDDMKPAVKAQTSLAKFEALPRDRQALKSSSGKKKKTTELNQWASSWNEAVAPSLGSTQTVRRDKFFSFVERNSIHYVRGCLYAGVDMDWANEYGQTALYICAWRGYEEMAELLVNFGAKTKIAANFGSSPFEIATTQGYDRTCDLIRESDDFVDEESSSEPSPSTRCIFPANPLDASPRRASTLIPTSTDHPGAGSYTIDQALSDEQIDWLLSLHGRIPVDTTHKKKAGLCSERSYFCDASAMISSAIQTTILNAGLGSQTTDHNDVQVFAHMRFLDYSVAGTTLNPHIDICRVDSISGNRSTHTLIVYLTDCHDGGETSLLGDVSGEQRSNILACICPKRGRLLLFPHACPHEGNEVRDVPKILLRGEVFLSE